jgi:hypothetical protein
MICLSSSPLRAGSRALIALAISAAALSAQSRTLFHWSGRVDRDVQISMRGDRMWIAGGDPSQTVRPRMEVETPLPRHDGRVIVQMESGRGVAEVIQQPTASNDYTAVLRVVDPPGGADRYRITTSWQPIQSSGGEYEVVPRRGRGRMNSRDDVDRPYEFNVARNALHWSGDVADAIEIRVQGDHRDYRLLGNQTGRSQTTGDLSGPGIPRDAVQLNVVLHEGRGRVVVAQQPTAENNYTALIRIIDPQPGAARYDFDVMWRR